jgi:hypothetical protein
MARLVRTSLAVAALLASSACGQDDAGGPRVTAASPSSSPSASPSSTDRGISADEARRSGVFTAEFDAVLDVRSAQQLELRNVGAQTDEYLVTVEPGGHVKPERVRLEPGESTTIQVTDGSGSTVQVASTGRDGAPIADAHLP